MSHRRRDRGDGLPGKRGVSSMVEPHEVAVPARSFGMLEGVIGVEAVAAARDRAALLRDRLAGRTVWNINSTATGGGVAEMLPSLIGYARDLGVETRWLVIEGIAPFFGLTKRLHHALHGAAGDGSPLGDAERAVYEQVAGENAAGVLAHVGPRDIVILHDPQTAGLAPHLARAGIPSIWRCHIGSDAANEEVARGWAFLAPYLEPVDAFVFTRQAYVPALAAGREVMLIPPSLDPLTAKNEDLDAETVRAVLVHTGMIAGESGDGPVSFTGQDGSPRRVERRAEVVRSGLPPPADVPLAVQVSRWDPLKDPLGVMHGFAAIAADTPAQLVLAGPDTSGVADDPEAAHVLEETIAVWRELPEAVRDRIHLVSLPTDDVEENAVMVNALQRHAAVIVQKSLQEGFGLTVTEALWKGRPVLASAVGGIQDQIEDGRDGALLADPSDLAAYGARLRELLAQPERAEALGRQARETVRERFLSVRHLGQYAELIERLEG